MHRSAPARLRASGATNGRQKLGRNSALSTSHRLTGYMNHSGYRAYLLVCENLLSLLIVVVHIKQIIISNILRVKPKLKLDADFSTVAVNRTSLEAPIQR